MPPTSDGPSWARRNIAGLMFLFLLPYFVQYLAIERMRGMVSPEMASSLQQILHAGLLFFATVTEMDTLVLLIGMPVAFLLAGIVNSPPYTGIPTWWGPMTNGVHLAWHAGGICVAQCCMRRLPLHTQFGWPLGLVGPPLVGGILLKYWVATDAVGDCSAQDLFLRAQVFENARLVVQAGLLETSFRLSDIVDLAAPRLAAASQLIVVALTVWVLSSTVGLLAELAAGDIRATTPSNNPVLLIDRLIGTSVLETLTGCVSALFGFGPALSGYSRSFQLGTGGCTHMQFPPTGTRESTNSAFLGTAYAKSAGVECATDNYAAVQAGLRGLWRKSLFAATNFDGVTNFDFVASTQSAAKAAMKIATGEILDSAEHALARYGAAPHAPIVVAPVIPAGCPVVVAGILRMYTEYAPTDQIGGWALIVDGMRTIAQMPECQMLMVVSCKAFAVVASGARNKYGAKISEC